MIVVQMFAAYLAGWFAWTNGEYMMHRFAMHEMKGRGMASREHLTHHANRDSVLEKWPVAWTGVVTVGIVVFFGGGNLLFATPIAIALAAGWIGGYGFYDWMHFRAHRRSYFSLPIAARYERRLRRHHFHHHFGHPMRNHTVTIPLCDILFGTLDRIDGPVRVPRRLAMVWLVDENGDLRPEHADDYVLVGTRTLTPEQATADAENAFRNLAPAV